MGFREEEEIRSIPVTLTYEIFSEAEISDIWLAMEGLARGTAFPQRETSGKDQSGYYVDPAIPKQCLELFENRGANILRVVIPFTAKNKSGSLLYIRYILRQSTGDQAVCSLERKGRYGSLTEGCRFIGGNAVLRGNSGTGKKDCMRFR